MLLNIWFGDNLVPGEFFFVISSFVCGLFYSQAYVDNRET